MSDKSPLFVSSMELLAHATELYALDNPRKFKFVVLHLANAIELILKDRLIDGGISIYLARKTQTLGIWESFDQLAAVGVQIPERPVIELLVDDRNTIQHRFGYPDAQTVFFYLEKVIAFFRRFLAAEYDVDLAEALKVHLSPSDLALIGLVKEEKAQEAALDRLFVISPESSLMQAFNTIERELTHILDIPAIGHPTWFPWNRPDFPQLLNDLASEGYISHDAAQNFSLLKEMRDGVAHAAHVDEGEKPIEPLIEPLRLAKEYLAGLDRANKEGFGRRWRARRASKEDSQAEPSDDRRLEEQSVASNTIDLSSTTHREMPGE
jgi:hypothetical protein